MRPKSEAVSNTHRPPSDFPELVEGLFFFSDSVEGEGFDKLSQIGVRMT